MTFISKKETLSKLLEDTESGKIKWEVSIERDFVRATHTINPTPNKSLVIKIVYFLHHIKGTKLTADFTIKGQRGKQDMAVLALGGKNKKEEVKQISYLMSRILLKEEDSRNIDIFIEDKFEIGDRVVVVKEQNFGGNEVGQKGDIVSESTDKDGSIVYVIKFDNHFDDILVDAEEAIRTGRLKDGNCWAFLPRNIKKISK